MIQRDYYTVPELKEFFTKFDSKFGSKFGSIPTGFFIENYVFKNYKKHNFGNIIDDEKIFGFFRDDSIYVLYENVKFASYGWTKYKDFIK